MIRSDFWGQRCAGQNWALIGDAAAHADPVTGIGIPYALTSSTLLAQSILSWNLGSYDAAWRDEYGHRLEQASATMERFIRTGDVVGFEDGMKNMCLATWLNDLMK